MYIICAPFDNISSRTSMSGIEESCDKLVNILREMNETGEEPSRELSDLLIKLSAICSDVE